MNDMTQSPPAAPANDILGHIIVWTPEIEHLCQLIADHIGLDLPGFTVYGPQRAGKTSSVTAAAQFLPDILGYPIAAFIWSIPGPCPKSERDFFQERLKQSGYGMTSQRDSAVLRARLFDYMHQAASHAATRRVIVMVDEAQNLDRVHYGYLIHCYNELERRSLKPFFMLIGQPELRHAVSAFCNTDDQQIIGRFFVQAYQYLGIHLDDIADVLHGFDTPVEEDALSVSERVLPAQHARGWRLAHLGPAIREALDLLLRQHNIEEELRMPMQYLRSTVLALLHHMRDHALTYESANSALVLQCLKKSGFCNVMDSYVVKSKDARSTEGTSGKHTARERKT